MNPLYKHQQDGIDKALPVLKSGSGFAFFFEPGTGKTRTTIETAMRLYQDGIIDAVMVSPPKSLAGTWIDQLEQHCNIEYKALVWDSVKKGSNKWGDEFKRLFFQGHLPFFIVNIEAFQGESADKHLDLWLKSRKVLWIIDESTTIKGPKSARTKKVLKLAPLAKCRLILTGTEVAESPLDLYSQMEFLEKGIWGHKNFFFFQHEYAVMAKRYLGNGTTFDEVVGFKSLDKMAGIIGPYHLRAKKSECLDLPEKIFEPVYVDMTPAQGKVYKDLKRDLMTWLANGEALTVQSKTSLFAKFRQITGGTLITENGTVELDEKPPKLDLLVDELSDTSEKAIIWAVFTHEVEMIANALSKIGETVIFHGATSEEDRVSAVERFNKGTARFFVANPAAGSRGLNLQADCSLMYYYSLPAGAEHWLQSQDRIHRIGQTKTCVYRVLMARGTVDTRVYELLNQKVDIANSFTSGKINLIDLI